MDTANDQSKEKRLERMVTTEQMSPSFVAACSTEREKELVNQEMEYLSDDCDSPGNSYEIYLGKVSRNPIVKNRITGKYFALPWSVIIRLALEKGIDERMGGTEIPH